MCSPASGLLLRPCVPARVAGCERALETVTTKSDGMKEKAVTKGTATSGVKSLECRQLVATAVQSVLYCVMYPQGFATFLLFGRSTFHWIACQLLLIQIQTYVALDVG